MMPSPSRPLAVLSGALAVAMAAVACGRGPDAPARPPAGVARAQRETPAPPLPGDAPDAAVVERFHRVWYDAATWGSSRWAGIPTQQNPMDVWIIQELLVEQKPDLVIECGSSYGGSAAIWAMVLGEVHPSGRVVSIDIVDRMAEARKLPSVRARVDFLVGSSTAPEIVAEVTRRSAGKKVLVFLDSDHTKAHVLAELRAYAPLVPVGGYVVVQDTNVNGHPVLPRHGPGPMEAVREFLSENGDFVVDESRERFLLTVSPGGYLKRVRS